jgi:hypothetical protein
MESNSTAPRLALVEASGAISVGTTDRCARGGQ